MYFTCVHASVHESGVCICLCLCVCADLRNDRNYVSVSMLRLRAATLKLSQPLFHFLRVRANFKFSRKSGEGHEKVSTTLVLL